MKNFIAIVSCFLFFAVIVSAKDNNSYIVIDKQKLELYMINQTDTLFRAPVCVGKNFGDKQRLGDMRTPEGTFTICQIQDSSWWTHDFHDGKGMRKGAYGPWFFRLRMPRWTTIGIHGTCFPASVGTRDSEGCVRLRNEDLRELKPYVRLGMKVTILKD